MQTNGHNFSMSKSFHRSGVWQCGYLHAIRHVCVCVCAHARVYVYLSLCLPASCVPIHTHVHTFVCVCVCVCVCSNGGYNVIQCSEREERESLLLVLSSV